MHKARVAEQDSHLRTNAWVGEWLLNGFRLLLLMLAVVLTAAFSVRLHDRASGSGGAIALLRFQQILAPPVALPAPPSDPRTRIEDRFAAVGNYKAYFERLKTVFPAEYQRIIDGLALRSASIDGNTAATAVDRAFFQAAKSLRQTHGILAARAEDGALGKISEVQSQVMEALSSRDPRLCADFFYGGAEPEFFAFMSQHRALAGAYAGAWLEAIASGKARPVGRPEPDDADVQLFDDAMVARGLTRDTIDALLENKPAASPLPDSALCEAGIQYFRVLGKLPDGPRQRLMARLLALAAHS